MMNEFDERYITKVLALQAQMGLESRSDRRIWHLIRSLLEYCDNRAINFDLLLADVRRDFNSGV